MSGVVIEHPHDITQDWDTILYHEGAHANLFCNRGYPPSELASLENVQIIAEYYASKMELEKRFPAGHDRQGRLESKVSNCYVNAINPLVTANKDLKRAAIEAALCVQICKDWGLYNNCPWIITAKGLEKVLKTASNPTLRMAYDKAAGILEKAPREFEPDQTTCIRRLQEEWFRDS